jgi:hypothetical protein
MSEVAVNPLALPPPDEPVEVEPAGAGAEVGSGALEPEPRPSVAVELLAPQAASSGSPMAETPASPASVLREIGSGVVRSVTGFLSGVVRVEAFDPSWGTRQPDERFM